MDVTEFRRDSLCKDAHMSKELELQCHVPECSAADFNDEYEEITSDEVDRIIGQLDRLIADCSSENIRTYLNEAADQIHALIYGDPSAEDQTQDIDTQGEAA